MIFLLPKGPFTLFTDYIVTRKEPVNWDPFHLNAQSAIIGILKLKRIIKFIVPFRLIFGTFV